MKTVFVCSTIWDLVDVRAEIREFLQRNGFQPIMSEHDDFPDDLSHKGTYDKCLDAVRTCDIFVLIVNNRYGGPRVLNAGEISIAHQEFRTAVETRRPFAGFIRDRLETDWQTWKRKPDPAALSFLRTEKDRHLFDVLEEINHSAIDGTALWRETFKDSIELKRKLAFKLGIDDIANNHIAQAQKLQALPRLTLDCTLWMGDWIGAAIPTFTIANTGSGAAEAIIAEIVTSFGKKLVSRRLIDVLPGKTIQWEAHGITTEALKDTPLTLSLSYSNILRSKFLSEFRIGIQPDPRNARQRRPSISDHYFGPPRSHP